MRNCQAEEAVQEVDQGNAAMVLPDPNPGAVQPAIRQGWVQVLEVPEYVSGYLIHALSCPQASRHLGSVAQISKARPSDTPPLGYAWFVVVQTDEGRRLRFWR